MRVDDKLPSRSVDRKAQKHDSRKGGSAARATFVSALSGAGERLTADDAGFDILKREVDAAGDALQKDPSMANYKAFRELLSRFAKKVTAEAYRVELLGGSPGAPAYHEVIRVIDAHADELYRLVMSEQKDRIRIAAKIEQIKGIVLSVRL